VENKFTERNFWDRSFDELGWLEAGEKYIFDDRSSPIEILGHKQFVLAAHMLALYVVWLVQNLHARKR
jgi:hypothetical protein